MWYYIEAIIYFVTRLSTFELVIHFRVRIEGQCNALEGDKGVDEEA